MICWECAQKLKLEEYWDASDLRSVEGLCQNCGKGMDCETGKGEQRNLAEVDLAIVETKSILTRGW